MARLLLGVSGGIAAYKALETARLAVRAGHAVRVIQTPASERFVGRASFAALTGAPVLRSEFEPDPARGAYPGEPVPERTPISHLALVERAEVLLIAPATANTVAKLAHGLADNLLSTAALAAACPVLVAPAMNDRMYRHPATRENLARLAERGVRIVPPGEGELASFGERGVGRLAEPEQLPEAGGTALAGAGGGARGGGLDGVRQHVRPPAARRAGAPGADRRRAAGRLPGRVSPLPGAADGGGGGRFSARRAGRAQAQEGRRASPHDRARADRGRAAGAGRLAAPGPGGGVLRRRARRAGSGQRAPEAGPQAAGRDRGQRRLPLRHRL